jgi:TonB family protein
MGPRVSAIATLLCAVSCAQSLVYRVGGDVTPPVLLSRQEPLYSEAARTVRLQGSVVLSTVIGEDGTAREIRVVKSLGLGLDENAIAAVAGCRFLPGTKGGEAVAVESNIEVNFRLPAGMVDRSPARAQFTAPPEASPTAVPRVPYAQPAGPPENASTQDSSGPKDDEVMSLIREWRGLEPPKK